MPVGGDVTQFSLGLMAFLQNSIQAGRLPYWNDLWGYGFPGIAESQMGVYYPAHLLLYGLLPLEAAYTASLVFHTIWAGWGASWAAQVFGVSRRASVVSGFAFGASGWFLIHLPHQWGATTGCWLPWALGIAWRLSDKTGKSSSGPLLLAAVLTLQILPGHFQLGFVTQLGVFLIAVCRLLERNWQGALRIAGGLVFMLPLGAAQFWPTFQLAELAANRRDFDYLSGFASPPTHFLSLIAPSLFHDSPLWRPILWDPFHAMPEEHLPYVGLAPLFLGLVCLRQRFRHSPEVKCLALVSLGMLVLSFGPYVPGFSYLIKLPGFSFFRAPARWGLGLVFGLSILGGLGLDLVIGTREICLAIRKLVGFSILVLVSYLLAFEVALIATEGSGSTILVRIGNQLGRLSPWDKNEEFPAIMAQARRPQVDLRVQTALARQGKLEETMKSPRLVDQRKRIYGSELKLTLLCLATLFMLTLLPISAVQLQFGLLLLSFIDLLLLAQHRPLDFSPVGSLANKSPVLARLAESPRGIRTIDPMGNLAMIVGAAPVAAYRTLDLSAMPKLTGLARGPLTGGVASTQVVRAMELIGTGVRILDPFELAELQRAGRLPAGWSRLEVIQDPALAGWLFGVDWIRQKGDRAVQFGLIWPDSATVSWQIAPKGLQSLEPGTDGFLRMANDHRLGEVLVTKPRTPELVELDLPADSGDSWVILGSKLFHPEWQATWSGESGARTANLSELSVRWQQVEPPEPSSGSHHLTLRYQASSEQLGQRISLGSWLIWGLVMARAWKLRRSQSSVALAIESPSK